MVSGVMWVYSRVYRGKRLCLPVQAGGDSEMRNWQPLGEKSYCWLLKSRLGRNQSSGFRDHRFPFFLCLSFLSFSLPPSFFVLQGPL